MVVEAIISSTRDRVLPGELGVLIGRITATEFVLHLSTGETIKASGHQIVAFRPGLPELIVPHMNQGDSRDMEPGPDTFRDLDS
jgi:hypothetical protein